MLGHFEAFNILNVGFYTFIKMFLIMISLLNLQNKCIDVLVE